VNGDIAAQEEQTVVCPEANSINLAKSLGKVLNADPSTLSLSEVLHEMNPQSMGNSSGSTEERNNKQEKKAEINEIIQKMIQKRQQIWEGIGKKQGIRIATLNINGR
jgi:hypothetical protein